MKAKARTVALSSHPVPGRRFSGLHARLGLLLALATSLVLLTPLSASAEIVVSLAGSGHGVVSSSPQGIECSNVPGEEKEASSDCTETFPFDEPPGSFNFVGVGLTATPDPDSVFIGWTGDDPFPGLKEGKPDCNAGSANPCVVVDWGEAPPEFGGPAAIHIAATFVPRPDPPLATTEPASGVGDTLATLHGSVDPLGTQVGDCHFEYGTTTSYGAVAPCMPKASELGEGNGGVAVSAQTEPLLEPGTTYHYRLVASNIGGSFNGADRTFATTGIPPCPNADRRIEHIESVLLPACMALEMVSPPQKGGQPADHPAISADGERIKFTSLGVLGGASSLLGVGGNPYVASRGHSGWTTAPTAPPGGQFQTGWTPSGFAQSFTPDFSRWFHVLATQPQHHAGIARAYRGGLGGLFEPLSPLLVPQVYNPNETRQLVEKIGFQGASTDLSHLYFEPGPGRSEDALKTTYLPGDPTPFRACCGSQAEHNTYVALLSPTGEPSLELLARDRLGKLWGGNCGAQLGGISFLNNGNRNQGAISPDGSRTYFSARPTQPASGECDGGAHKLRILKRLETSEGIHIEELFGSECNRVAPPCDLVDGDDRYQGASVDGSRVYFNTNRQLASSDLDTGSDCSREEAKPGCDLYLYDPTQPPGQRLIQVSAGDASAPTPGSEAKVYGGTIAISGDGSHVYFAAQGVLTTDPNPEGKNADEFSLETPKLYLYERSAAHPSGRTAFVGPLDSSEGWFIGNLWGSGGGSWRNDAYAVPVLGEDHEGNETGGDGHILVFETKAPLTADDTDGGSRDVFRYDAFTSQLERVSRAAPGGEDNAAADVRERVESDPLGTDFAEQSRWVSEDGETVLFGTAEGLVRGDSNGVEDAYIWREGRPYLLPGIAMRDVGLSHDGDEVAFATSAQLLPQDGDVSSDVYVARGGGGFAPPPAPAPCDAFEEGSCRGPAAVPPPAPSAASESNSSSGNAKPQPRKRCPKGKRLVRRNGKAHCRKPHRRRRQTREAHTRREANTDRRAAR